MRVTKLNPDATIPTRATPGSAGLDLYALQNGTIVPKSSAVVDTGVAMEIPPNHVGLIKSRSSLASKHGIDVAAGVIDSDYRGPVMVLLRNVSDELFSYAQGDRVAQMLIIPVATPEILLSDTALDKTDRGAGGFGSTGK